MPQLGCAFAPARGREGGRHYKIVVKCKEKVASATTQLFHRVELTLLQVHFIQTRLQVQRVYFFFVPGLHWRDKYLDACPGPLLHACPVLPVRGTVAA